MAKKSRRNRKNNGGPLQKVLVAVPTAAPSPAMSELIRQLLVADKYDDILKVESKYHHLDSFSDDPAEDAFVLWAFGRANHAHPHCMNRAIITTKEPKSALRKQTPVINARLKRE